MKTLKLTLCILLTALRSACAQSTNETQALTAALQLEAGRGTNTDGFCFLSVQHPEWPPMPTPPDTKLEIVRIGVGTYLVDDSTWNYPTPPAPATNSVAQRVLADPLMGVTLNTNFFRENPSQASVIKGFNLRDCPTNTPNKWQNSLNARRVRAVCDAIDSIISSLTNTSNVNVTNR